MVETLNRSTRLAGARVVHSVSRRIDEQAKANGQSRSDWVRTAIEEKLTRTVPKRDWIHVQRGRN